LDNRVTADIENSILNIENLTSVVVTHKLNESLLRKYNRIVFMKNGVIAETGSFEELLAKKGEFYNLFRLSM
jgi:ABC-type multidrug transport system fused ATPase/permease subunit